MTLSVCDVRVALHRKMDFDDEVCGDDNSCAILRCTFGFRNVMQPFATTVNVNIQEQTKVLLSGSQYVPSASNSHLL